MKKKYLLLFFTALLVAYSNFGIAQMFGTVGSATNNIFFPGHYLEIGQTNIGAFGTNYFSATNSVPTTYYPNPGGTTATNQALASVYDQGHDGWTTGTPAYFGDYTLPGDPFEGWGIQINGTTGQNFAFIENADGAGTASAISGSGTLSGNNVSYTNAGGVLSALWQGTAGIGGVLSISQVTRVDTNGSSVIVTVVLKNTGAAAIPNIYYLRTCDPDDDETNSSSYETDNTITYQNDRDHRVLVSTTGETYRNAYMGLGTKDCRAKAFIYESWPIAAGTNLASVYAGTAGITETTAENGTDDGDYAIGLVYDIGTIGAYDSTVLSYAYVYNGISGLDSAFPDPVLVVNDVAVDSVDTFNTCAYPSLTTLPVNIANATNGVYTYSTWKWSPAIGLATTTGVNNSVNLLALSVPVTYTIVGTDSLTGVTSNCERDTFLLTVNPCFTASNNGPVCLGDTLDLYAHAYSVGVTFAWYHPTGTLISTLQNPVIPNSTFADSGVFMVVKTSDSTGVSDTVYTDVVIKPLPVVSIVANSFLCAGSTLVFIASVDSADETFFWTGPDGFTSTSSDPTITPVSLANTGVYNVYTSLNGCVDNSSVYVQVNPLPDLPILSNDTLCSDSSLHLIAYDSTAGVSYLWSGPNGFTSTVQDSTLTNITTAASGIYTVAVTITATGCSDSDTMSVLVKPTPPPPVLTNNSIVCSGNALDLFARDSTGAIAGTTYSWTGPDNFSSTLQDPVINPASTLANGIYTAVATLNGCPSSPTIQGAAVDSTPAPITISSNGPICQYSTLQLFASSATDSVTYSWTSVPAGFTSTLQNPVIDSAATSATAQYSVSATLGSCTSSAVISVEVDSIPVNVSISSLSPICSQNNLTLLSTFTPPGGVYYWSGPNGFTSSGAPDATVIDASTAASGTYSVTETLGICMSAVYTVAATVDSTPQVPYAFKNDTVCEYAANQTQYDTLQLSAADSTYGVSYSWVGPNGFSSNVQDPSITQVSLADSGTYFVTATLGICTSSASIVVSITPRPAFTPASNSPVCSGDTLKLYANDDSGAAYTWSGPYGYYAYASTASSYRYITDVTTENAGVYTVTAWLNGCPASETDTVVINNTPAVPSVSWLTYCQYYPAPPLMANDTNVKWYPTDSTLPSLGSYTPPIPSTQSVGSAFYYARQIVNGCISAEDSIKVTVNPTPAVTVSPVDTAVCPHSTVMLRARDTDAIAYYSWYPSIYLNDTTGDSVIVSPETNQAYNVVASNQYGCSDTASAFIKVYPAALISMADSVTLYPGQSYTMNPSTNCTVFTWFPPAGLTSTTIPDPIASPVLSTDYILYGETENGCTTSDSINIYVSVHSDIHLPNAFTPGSGPNGTYKVITDGIVSLHYFRIFNRWGQKVYETTDINDGWDGTFNGTAQPLGVYIYEIEGISSTGQTLDLQGNLTLLR